MSNQAQKILSPKTIIGTFACGVFTQADWALLICRKHKPRQAGQLSRRDYTVQLLPYVPCFVLWCNWCLAAVECRSPARVNPVSHCIYSPCILFDEKRDILPNNIVLYSLLKSSNSEVACCAGPRMNYCKKPNKKCTWRPLQWGCLNLPGAAQETTRVHVLGIVVVRSAYQDDIRFFSEDSI